MVTLVPSWAKASAAGCAPNRADAIRWSLARVRERPPYQKVLEHVRELQALRAKI